MQLLCFLNYILNDEKYSLHDIFIKNSLQEHFAESINRNEADKLFFNDFSENDIIIHNTYELDNRVMRLVLEDLSRELPHSNQMLEKSNELQSLLEDELRRRYSIQLDYYAMALSQITGLKVKEKVIYSFALGRSLTVE